MSGHSTVLSAGAATVPASGSYTAVGLAQVQAVFDAQASLAGGATIITYDAANPTLPTVPAEQFGQYILVVPNTVPGPLVLNLPSGYGAVVLERGTTASISGGDATTRIVSGGVLTYDGPAMLVDASGGTGTIHDDQANAIVAVGGGAYSVTALGAGAVVRIDNGGPDSVVAGAGAFLQLGDGSPGSVYYEEYPAAATVSSATVKTGHGDMVTVDGTGFLIVDNAPGAGASTIDALYGSSTVFGGSGDVYDGRMGLARTEFIGTGSTQTVFGGASNDTIFGQAGQIVYDQGSGSFSLFVAGSGAATVNAQGGGVVFGEAGRTLVNLGGSRDLFVGGDGDNATIVSGGANPTVFGGSNETVRIIGSPVAFAVQGGGNSVMDASGAAGTVHFFAGGAYGNVTLIGVAAGLPDTYQIASAAPGHPQTIDIQNWHASDGLFLGEGFTQADVAAFDTAITSGGGALIVLPDGTTIRFDGAHPTSAAGPVGY